MDAYEGKVPIPHAGAENQASPTAMESALIAWATASEGDWGKTSKKATGGKTLPTEKRIQFSGQLQNKYTKPQCLPNAPK